MNRDEPDSYLTPIQLADRQRRAPHSLANDRSRGVGVPFHRFGRLVRYRLRDVLAYEDAQRVGTSRPDADRA